MKCYYEELGIPRDASDGDIKTAYRKLALRWHPDKNLDCADDAKEKFQLIQQAYDVLSDSHERAWYDNHREQILRGKNSEYEENCLDLFQYFTVSCFRGYGDNPKGFYKVYAEVFEKVAAEDAEFMDDEEEVAQIPKFGDSTSSYDDVVGPFYAYWQSYCTKKTYTWLCPYDIQEIKDRRILREVEKELKKVAQKAKKERNEEVRNLVSFVRKRDKRMQAYKKMLEERAVANRQKQEQNRLEQIRKRNKDLEEMRKNHKLNSALNDGYEEQLKQLEQQYGVGTTDEEITDEDETAEDGVDSKEISGEIDALNINDELEYVDDLYCIACNKSFKNERAFANHESSKKHRENVERLKQEMQDDEEMYGDTTDEDDENGEDEEDGAVYDKVLDDETEDVKGSTADLSETESIKLDSEKEEVAVNNSVEITSSKKSKKNKKSKKTNKSQTNIHAEESDLGEEISSLPQLNDESDDDWQNLNKKFVKKSKNKQTKTKPVMSQTTSKETNPETQLKAEVQLKSEPHMIYKTDATPAKPICVTCKATFESKNKLFAHLKITNHGIPKAKPDPVDTSKSKSKGKRK